ncbi:hypothetical protein [Clostridium sp. KNHs214]|uniref:hypothetical protein n=1 Tax=Clostridium sp. KNHs214 TaxID=1540257 RepID=UPI0005584199|nr:hypothetical protein [Clostridium sp. KNHs214]
MKISKREQLLLSVLVVLCLGLLYYKLILAKQNRQINDLMIKKANYEEKVSKIKNKIARQPKIKSDIKKVNSKIMEDVRMIFPEIEQERIIIAINKLLNDSNLTGNVINFTESKLVNLSGEDNKDNKKRKEDKALNSNELTGLVQKYNEINGEENNKVNNKKATIENKKGPSGQAEKMSININFKGNHPSLMNFIKSVEGFSKKIIISKIDINTSDGNNLSGILTLDIYGIPQFNVDEYIPYDFDVPHGKNDPFAGGVIAKDTVSEPKKEVYDFLMSVRAETSDLPTIILGEAKDKNEKTYVYGDKNDVEQVSMELWKKSGQYYYRYKTSRDKYPMSYEAGSKLKPQGNEISIKVYSNPRKSNGDMAGVNFKVNNKTNLNLNIVVENDDRVAPRVNIIKEGGNINIR